MWVSPRGIRQVKELSSVRAQAGTHQLLTSRQQQFRHRLIDGLFVNAKGAGAVGDENHRLIVGGPVKGQVLTVIKRETLRFRQSTGSLQLRNIDIRLWNSFDICDALAVSGGANAEYLSLIVGQAH